MVGVLEAIVIASCVGFSGNSHDVCLKTLEASLKQSGIAQNVDDVEQRISKRADSKVRKVIGNSGMDAGATGAFIIKGVVEKSVFLKFPIFMPSMFLNTQIGSDKSQLGIQWMF